MSRVLHVAWRDFRATALTRGFILGAFVVPVVLTGVMILGFKLLLKQESPRVEGTLAVLDPTGQVVDEIADRLRPEAIAQGDAELGAEVAREIRERVGDVGGNVGEAVAAGIDRADKTPKIRVTALPPAADLEAEKARLLQAKDSPGALLALAVIDEHAVVKADDRAKFGGFQLFVREKQDDRVVSDIRSAIRESIKTRRIIAADLDRELLEALMRVDAPKTKEFGAEGERDSLAEVRIFVPLGFMAVLMISVMLGGQYLLTTTVEEKSSRVVEVLLSALSPMELMGGKILGQLGVGLSILLIYGGLGWGALWGILGFVVGFVNLFYLIAFFLIAYFTIGAMMAAVGSAVNELREAQSLQTPIMLLVVTPYMLWFPLSRDPNGLAATICSFIPPISSFVMILRITSTEPPPTWQVLVSIAAGLAGAYVAVWAAAKVFRIGLLMFGKAPNLATLIRWIRMA